MLLILVPEVGRSYTRRIMLTLFKKQVNPVDVPTIPEKPLPVVVDEEADIPPSLAVIEGTVTRVKRWRESTLTDRGLEFDIVIEYIMKHNVNPNDIGLQKDELEIFRTRIHKEKIKSNVANLLRDLLEENNKRWLGLDLRNKDTIRTKIDQIKKLINENNISYEECNIDLPMVSKLALEN